MAKEPDFVFFVVEYENGTAVHMEIDKDTLSGGDHVAPVIAREKQLKGILPKGEIRQVRRLSRLSLPAWQRSLL